MNSLPTIKEVSQYDKEITNNDHQMVQLFNVLFPDIPNELVYEVAKITTYLSETRVNPDLIPRVIRGVHNILIGTGKGQVIVHVQQHMTNVSVRETDEEVKATRD